MGSLGIYFKLLFIVFAVVILVGGGWFFVSYINNEELEKSLVESTKVDSEESTSNAEIDADDSHPLGVLELLDSRGAPIDDLMVGESPIIVVASTNSPNGDDPIDVREHLPITVEFTRDSNGKAIFKIKIPDKPDETCRDDTGCSTHGPLIKPEWVNEKIKVTSRGKDGELLTSDVFEVLSGPEGLDDDLNTLDEIGP